MQGQSIKIDGLIIDPTHIIMIDLDAQEVGFGYMPENAVRITLAAISGEFGYSDRNSGSWDTKTLLYTGAQAEALRPWLVKMFPCEGRSIRLPEVDTESGEGDGDDDKPEKCFECHEPIEVAVNERFCSKKCDRAWQKFLAEIPF